MSSQKGNASRSRPQKYQNRHVFKNDLHDTSHRTKFINSIDVANVCERCKNIIEWKIKYKKYKPLKAPSKCVKCEQKTVKHAYHTMCAPCARENRVCPKCGTKAEVVTPKPTIEEQVKLDTELQAMLKSLPERKRRTFIRYMKRKGKSSNGSDQDLAEAEDGKEQDGRESTSDESKGTAEPPRTREELYEKLKSLKVSNSDKDDLSDFDDSDFEEEEDD